MIAIETNKEMRFLSTKGFIRMQIDLIQNDTLNTYTMRIIDSCIKYVTVKVQVPIQNENGEILYESKDIIRENILESKGARFKTMTYKELDDLVEALSMDMNKGNMRESYHELFKRGLLFITQQECEAGISGEPGKGMYFTEASDWVILE